MYNEELCKSDDDLIEFRHVGVTAKIKSPLKGLLLDCSAAETDEMFCTFRNRNNLNNNNNNTTLYSKFTPSDETETTCGGQLSPSTEDSKLLYEMNAERKRIYRRSNKKKQQKPQKSRNAFTRIEFKLHKTSKKQWDKPKYSTPKNSASRKRIEKKPNKKEKLNEVQKVESVKKITPSKKKENTFLKRLRCSLSQLFSTRSPTMNAKQLKDPFSDLEQQIKAAASVNEDENFFYPFERGCVDFLCTTDSPPDLITDQLAERANRFATRFWAEFFGLLNVGVALLVALLLQTYRFVLFTLVNTLLVGLLRMTSDYLIKPLLSALFNGFVQPFLLLFQNLFAGVRDTIEPIADAFNNCLKPLAMVFGSLSLVKTSCSRPFVKEA